MSTSPELMNWIVERAIEHLHVEKVYLFGSRARGTAQPESDFDLAFSFPEKYEKNWSRFSLTVNEEARTLRKLDLINLRTVSEDIKSKVLQEGKVIYDSRQKAR